MVAAIQRGEQSRRSIGCPGSRRRWSEQAGVSASTCSRRN